MTTIPDHPGAVRRAPRTPGARAPLALAATALALAIALPLASAAARGPVGSVDLVPRGDARVLPVHEKDGRRWVVGTPGQEYAIRLCNTTAGRVLAVLSVDGVNAVSGETASPEQTGYVLGAYECADINGWRKSLDAIAAFYFTTLPDAYAARTGRPDNVGVIGVAFFRELPRRRAWLDAPGKLAAGGNDAAGARHEAPATPSAAGPAAEGRASEATAQRDSAERSAPTPAPAAKVGTGYGRHEPSRVETTQFERESEAPSQTVVIHYDRRENLVAMGVLPPPAIARAPNPFPAYTPRFVPAPPR